VSISKDELVKCLSYYFQCGISSGFISTKTENIRIISQSMYTESINAKNLNERRLMKSIMVIEKLKIKMENKN
jgi:hypothetical protein